MDTTSRTTPTVAFESQLTEQLGKNRDQLTKDGNPLVDKTLLSDGRPTGKPRSLSDAARKSPSPNTTNLQRASKDDIHVGSLPTTPQRTGRLIRGLSLQLPPKIFGNPSPGSVITRTPLSPKLDSSHIYGSPASVLPRRSRGLDFSRACTNLHHSTLAESSPDSSPVVIGRGVSIPQRRIPLSSGLVSPNNAYGSMFPFPNHSERPGISSSMSSVNMFDSDSSSSSDEDDDASMHTIDREDPIVTTPHVSRAVNGLATPFSPNTIQSPGGDWMAGISAAKASLMSFQRARFRGRSKHSSSSTSGSNSRPGSGPISPPVLKSIETPAAGYFNKDLTNEVKSRRESLSLGTSDLHLSDMSDDERILGRTSSPSSGSLAGSHPENGRRGVIRRPVTRRGNLFPKTKNFARIRAALIEESAPIDFESQREAEVIRQVRESDADLPPVSPSIAPGPPELDRPTTGEPQTSAVKGAATLSTDLSATSFSSQANQNSGGMEFWNTFDERYRTPPPPVMHAMGTTNTPFCEDAMMETPLGTPTAGPSRVAAEAARKGKRRRDDDLDANSFKRRAVSPGMSGQSSPVIPQGAAAKDARRASQLPKGHLAENGQTHPHATPKRIGLQGMTETNDGLMNMSID
ncbi:hypothetical protein AJ80_00495 [Polytolypa hystricis UAMH7299]|uniref:Uncharacterized protein n=1 Tax=Polytolypa hystricis (strain UAMH7299) TaxID=1447883 RepID=A0A2B7Z3K6_POLH7|nr:hypothetical protein AJ80_00495 [Polytolypa hystricis UAMH7299]